ncbi:hypothetical protein BD769DRAFT_1386664 [Suillus cothurnatus]|nr:hypothetical protein BD769DRAFT_1386664 [Suillus cothurnatus]
MVKTDPKRSRDTRVLTGNEDAHLDAPQLLDLLSEKPVEGANKAPQQQEGLYIGPLRYSSEKMIPSSFKKVNGPYAYVRDTQSFPLERIRMEYSANDVKVAKNMQIFVLSIDGDILGMVFPISFRLPLNLFIQTYDYICSLHAEWTFYFGRAGPKLNELTYCASVAMVPNEDNNCMASPEMPNIDDITTCFLSSEPTSSEIPGLSRNTDSFLILIPFILMFVFQLVLISLTLVRVIQSWRSTNGPLYAILVKHSIFYYACGLLLSTGEHPCASTNVALSNQLMLRTLSSYPTFFLKGVHLNFCFTNSY